MHDSYTLFLLLLACSNNPERIALTRSRQDRHNLHIPVQLSWLGPSSCTGLCPCKVKVVGYLVAPLVLACVQPRLDDLRRAE